MSRTQDTNTMEDDTTSWPVGKLGKVHLAESGDTFFGGGTKFDRDFEAPPQLYLRLPGEHSRLAGFYTYTYELRGDLPGWRRVGSGAEVLLQLKFEPALRQWVFEAALIPEPHVFSDGEMPKVGSEPLHVDLSDAGGWLDRPPTWADELLLKVGVPDDVVDAADVDELKTVVFARQRGMYHEGMPVYRSVGEVLGDWWLASKDGRWRCGQSPPGRISVESLVMAGFFGEAAGFSSAWKYRSEPHSGRGPEQVVWESGARALEPMSTERSSSW